MSYKLWLEDLADTIKPAPDATWKVARSSAEAIEILKEHGVPSFISFDFDLGLLSNGENDTAENYYKFMAENYYDSEVPDYEIHSENTQGWKLIHSYMESWRQSQAL
jgi:hypothetical protein